MKKLFGHNISAFVLSSMMTTVLTLPFASCTDKTAINEESEDQVLLTLTPYTTEASAFSLTTTELTRADAKGPSEANCQYLVAMVFDQALMDNEGYTPDTKTFSVASSENIDQVTLALQRGHSYKIAIVASEKVPTPSAGTVSYASLSSTTFWACKEVSVSMTAASAQALNVTLARPVAKVQLSATDSYPNALSGTVTFTKRTTTLNMLTGYGVPAATPFQMELSGYTAFMPDKSHQLSISTFVDPSTTLTLNEATLYNMGTISLALNDNSVQVGYMSYDNVAVERNRATIITGPLFTPDNALTISVDESWGEDINLNW